MADLHKIVEECKRCEGSGSEDIGKDIQGNPINPITCRKCSGVGTISTSSLHPDLIDLLNGMNNKINDIFEKVNE